MDYFRLEQDKRIPFDVWIKKLMALKGMHEAMKGDLQTLEEMNAVEVTGSADKEYPEVLDKQLFLVKDVVKEAFGLYMPRMQYKEFFLIDMVKTSYERYYAPILPVVDCLSPKSECSRDKSVIHKAVLEKNGMAAGNDSIFRIGNILDKVIIVRLDVAESILRRKPYGIRLTHVDVIE